MPKTKNRYSYPIGKEDIIKLSYKDSPAHKGQLKNAVDFIIPERTQIKAALRGIVVDLKKDSGRGGSGKINDKNGNYIEIKHTNDEYSIYEHIKKNGAVVKRGDKIKTGQLIGYSGATGWIAHLGPHLHFDVHKYYGKNPEEYKTLKITWKKQRD